MNNARIRVNKLDWLNLLPHKTSGTYQQVGEAPWICGEVNLESYQYVQDRRRQIQNVEPVQSTRKREALCRFVLRTELDQPSQTVLARRQYEHESDLSDHELFNGKSSCRSYEHDYQAKVKKVEDSSPKIQSRSRSTIQDDSKRC